MCVGEAVGAIGPRQAHSASTLNKLCDGVLGEDHLRAVLTCIVESEGNERALVQPVLAPPQACCWLISIGYEVDASRWLSVFDRVDLLALFEFTKANCGRAPLSSAVGALLFAELAREFESSRVSFLRDERTACSCCPICCPRSKELRQEMGYCQLSA